MADLWRAVAESRRTKARSSFGTPRRTRCSGFRVEQRDALDCAGWKSIGRRNLRGKLLSLRSETGKLQATLLPGHDKVRAYGNGLQRSDGRTRCGQLRRDDSPALGRWHGSFAATRRPTDKVYRLAVPNGKILASGGSHGTACLWDMASDLLKRWDHDSVTHCILIPKGSGWPPPATTLVTFAAYLGIR